MSFDNPVNLTDPSGYQTECNANGYCPEIDRFECWRTWQEGWGAYDLNWQPCIVNPANVQTGNAPSWPSSSPPPAPPITVPPTCDPGRPCKVILGANRVEAFGNMAVNPTFPGPYQDLYPYHHYILVVDPNNVGREGLPNPIPFNGPTSIGNLVQAGDNVTVYHFGAFSEFSLNTPGWGSWGTGLFPLGHLIPKIELYQESLDVVNSSNRGALWPQYELRADQVDCEDVLRCLRNTAMVFASLNLDYDALGTNSNFFAKTMLRKCGFEPGRPVKSPAPGWDYEVGWRTALSQYY